MSRWHLHITHFDDFKAFLDWKMIAYRPGKGDYQVLQVSKDCKHWDCIYRRDSMPEHFTVTKHLESLVDEFYRKRKATA